MFNNYNSVQQKQNVFTINKMYNLAKCQFCICQKGLRL